MHNKNIINTFVKIKLTKMSKQAEEYLNELVVSFPIKKKDVAHLMESYHQHRVNSITDEEIDKFTETYFVHDKEYYSGFSDGKDEGIKWLKQKLTNKE